MLRRLRSCLLVLALNLALLHPASVRAAEAVDVLLVLAVDVSRSISAPKFELERRGYAEALTDPRVVAAIGGGKEGRIALTLIEWAGPDEQQIVVEWTAIGGEADAKRFAERLLAAPRSFYGRTAVGSAIDFSADLIARAPFRAERRVIDVSGDGTSNGGRSIEAARDAAVARGITINGIVILTDPVGLPSYLLAHTNPPGGLATYYRETVIGGEGAFVMTAESFETFGRALVAKLVKEIS